MDNPPSPEWSCEESLRRATDPNIIYSLPTCVYDMTPVLIKKVGTENREISMYNY